MDIHTFLNQVIDFDKTIDAKVDMLHSLEAAAEQCTARLEAVPGGGSKDPHGALENLSIRISDLADEISQDVYKLNNLRMELVDFFVENIDDYIARRIFVLRYCDGRSYEEIASELCYSERWIRKRHSKVLRRLSYENKPPVSPP